MEWCRFSPFSLLHGLRPAFATMSCFVGLQPCLAWSVCVGQCCVFLLGGIYRFLRMEPGQPTFVKKCRVITHRSPGLAWAASVRTFNPCRSFWAGVPSERGEQIKGGRGGAGGRGSGREGFGYTRIWSSVIKSSRETSGERNCQKKGGARISAAFSISACGQADFEREEAREGFWLELPALSLSLSPSLSCHEVIYSRK